MFLLKLVSGCWSGLCSDDRLFIRDRLARTSLGAIAQLLKL
ncbi:MULTISPECIES: hypothetical protein [Chroococcidiopsis]|nr:MULTISPECIES: hypothetical protein [Chroococcidiopsis]